MRRSFVAVVSRRHIAAAFTVVLVAAAFAAQSSPARSTSAAAGQAATTTFVSKKYGYTLVLAGPWLAQYAVTKWLGEFTSGPAPDVDQFSDLRVNRYNKFFVAAKRVSAGTTLENWTASQVATSQAVISNNGQPQCNKSRAFRNTTLGGEPAREFQNACPFESVPHLNVITVTALHHGRGYVFELGAAGAHTAASDRRMFDAARHSFHFTAK